VVRIRMGPVPVKTIPAFIVGPPFSFEVAQTSRFSPHNASTGKRE
jgi:hypothetical protein